MRMNRSFEIESDCLDIIVRLKAIDEGYFVKYNLDTKSFELHHREQFGDTFCLTFPYSALDERCVDYARQTRVSNSDKLLAEVEKDNARLEKHYIKEKLNDLEEKIYDSQRYIKAGL